MNVHVSISQFRQNIAGYIEKAQSGIHIVLEDEKKGKQVAQLIAKKTFDAKSFRKALESGAGVFTLENHPEWKTEQSLRNWLVRERLADDRDI